MLLALINGFNPIQIVPFVDVMFSKTICQPLKTFSTPFQKLLLLDTYHLNLTDAMRTVKQNSDAIF
jgi:hypothetical protein